VGKLNDDSRALARRLITTRLIVAGQDAQGRATIELAHDALITHWARLREWVDADRGFRMWLDEFRTQASQWDRSDQSPDLLLRGVALRSAANWCRQRTQELSTIEMTYLDRSIESSKRTGRRRRLAIASIATAIVVILLAGLLAVNRGRTASIERAVASSRAYAAASESTVAEDFAKSALLAVLAYKTSPTVEAEKALFRSYTGAVGSKEVLSGWIGRRDDLSASADGHLVVAISHANDRNYLTVWTRDQGSPTRRKSIVIPRTTDVNVTQDGAVVIISSPDGFHQIDPATEIVRNLTGPVGNHGFTDINRDGTLAVTANSSSGSTEYTVWNLHSGERVATKRIDHGEYPSGRPYMAADGSSVVLNYNPHGGIDRNTAQVWNYRTGDVRLLADEFHSLFVTRDGVAITCRISQPAAGNDPSKISVCWAGAVARNASLASMSDRIAALERKR